MTDRRPLVIVSGLKQELPAGDNIADPVLAAVSQLCGFTPANIMEVEANTRAARITLRPQSIGPDVARDLVVGHYSLSMVGEIAATTVAISAQPLIVATNNAPAICMLKKLTVGCVTKALTGARTGAIKMRLGQYLPVVGADASSVWIQPPVGSNVGVSVTSYTPGNPYNGLKTNQPLPTLVISTIPGSQTIPGVATLSKTLGEVFGNSQVTVGGMNIPPTVLFDHLAAGHTPYTMGYNSGFQLVVDAPAAGTSQTLSLFATMQWTEFQLDTPF